jgi:hypothetical protein
VFVVFFVLLFFLQQFSVMFDFLVFFFLLIACFLGEFGSVGPVDFGVDDEYVA